MTFQDNTGTVVSVWDLKAGDIIRDDVPVRVLSATNHGDYEMGLVLKDGNGYTWCHYVTGGEATRFNWTEEEWAAYCAS